MAGARRPVSRPNPRPQNSMGGMPGRGGPATGPHMELGQKGQDTGHQLGGRPSIDPGFNRNQPIPPPNRGSDSWLNKHPNGPLAQQGQRGTGGGNLGMPQMPPSPWGAGNGYNMGTSMEQTARNEYLNTLAVGGEREAAMNAMGYWNGGTPFNPTDYRGQGYNKFGNANASGVNGTYDSPGIYQQMNAGNTGYLGAATIGDEGTGSYQSFIPGGGGRIKRRGGTTGGYIQ